MDAGKEAAAVYSGEPTATDAQSSKETPEKLTRQANQLRRIGFSGYAGAARLYRLAAKTGYAPAQNNLGAMYEQGLGIAPDIVEAAHWYRLAAEQGEAHAQHSIGMMLMDGRGVERNASDGIRWLEKAAKQGHASACADLGRLYAKGGENLDKNPNKATFWWRQAERHGYPGAAEALRALTRNGQNSEAQ